MKKLSLISLTAFFCIVFLPAQSNFHFAHVTDIHVGSTTGAEDLRNTVRDINQQKDLRFVIITGDISEFGADAQWRLAKQILDSLTLPWYIVPGNHDMKWAESGGTGFKKVFGYERIMFPYGKYTFIGLHEGPRLKMGDGYWAPEDLRWLDSTLAPFRINRKPIILFTHYPLDSGIANWYEALSLLKQCNIQVILNGHWHSNNKISAEGIPSIVGRTNLRGRDSLGGYNIVDVRNDSIFYSVRTPGVKTAPYWASATLFDHHFEHDTTTYPRPSYAVNKEFPNVVTTWQFNAEFTITSTPLVFDQSFVVFGDYSGSVYCLDIDKKKIKWKMKANDAVFSSPEYADGKIYFTSADSYAYCVNAKNGKVLWKYKTENSLLASPRAAEGKIFFGSSNNSFYALNASTGKLAWRYDSLNGFVETKPLYSNGKIIFGVWDEHLYCLNAESGSLLWKWKGSKNGVLLSPAACEPVSADGKVFIAAPDRFLTAINISNGETIWRTGQFMVRETIGISKDGKRLYARTMNDSLYALSAESNEPAVIWKLNAEIGYDINSAQIREKEGIIFYPTKNGIILAVDGKTGKLLWKHRVGVGVTNTIAPISKNKIVVTDFDGNLSVVEVQ
ncbi:MAG: PQQ-binding-like beta-propeller repeat protein [Bacteroidetes bacterium]|nr:PQQ-binding-like beta-propeller repeat protein [Bacteroidota bacterium]